MRDLRLRLLLLAALLGACAIPSRNNGFDPGVKPVAAISITVGGEATAIGGRNAGWRFDGRASSDPSSALSTWLWSISAGPDLPTDPSGWVPVGNGTCGAAPCENALLDETASIPLRVALNAISDFVPFDPANPEPGTGTAKRWIQLVLVDANGHRGDAHASFTVVNHKPSVSLGPDRRVSPGGKWWTALFDVTGDGRVTVEDAAPWEVVIRADATDVDPGDVAFAFDIEHPASWTVKGPLARVLDLDGDGRIDDVWFPDDPIGHRVVRFPAPIYPQRNRVDVEVGDVLAGGVLLAKSGASVRVDVLTNHWVYDEGALELKRLDTSTFIGPGAGNGNTGPSAPIAASLDRFLVAGYAGLQTYDVALKPVSKVPVPWSQYDSVSGASDGADGWWVEDRTAGVLRHIAPDLSVDLALTDVDGDAVNDFAGGSGVAAAPSSGVWALGAGSSLLHVARDGSATKTIALPSATGGALAAGAIAEDLHGGAWIGGVGNAQSSAPTPARLRHVDAGGNEVAAIDLPLPSDAMPGDVFQIRTLASDGSAIWATVEGPPGITVTRVDPSGAIASAPSSCYARLYADASDGTVGLPCGGLGGMFIYSPDATGTSLSFVPSFFSPGLNFGPLFGAGDNSLVAVTVTGFAGAPGEMYAVFNLLGVEAGRTSPSVSIPVPYVDLTSAPNLGNDGISFAVDGRTGFLWVWRPDCGCIQTLSTTGDVLASIPVTFADGLAAHAHAAIALDEESRVAWLALSASPNGLHHGGLLRIAMPDDPAEVPPVERMPGVDIRAANEVAVVPGDGQVCVAAFLTNGNIGFSWRPDQSERIDVTTYPYAYSPVAAAADPVRGDCWFFENQVYRMGATTSSASVATWSAPFGNVAAYDPAKGAISSFTAAGDVTTASSDSPVVWKGGVEPDASPWGFAADPLYGHLYLGFSGSPGTVSRIDGTFHELSRESDLSGPRFH